MDSDTPPVPGGPSSDRSQAKGTRHLHSMQYIENSDIHIYSGFFKILHELNIRVSVQKKIIIYSDVYRGRRLDDLYVRQMESVSRRKTAPLMIIRDPAAMALRFLSVCSLASCHSSITRAPEATKRTQPIREIRAFRRFSTRELITWPVDSIY